MSFDCCFTRDNNWFRFRAAAIIVEEGCVLFMSNGVDNYCYSVGGGVHMGEAAEDAVKREVFEETGVHYEIDRLAVIHENFFNQSEGSLKGLCCHEVALYYLMKPIGRRVFDSHNLSIFGTEEKLVWIPVDELGKGDIKTFPEFMKDYLAKMPEGVVHIVSKE